MHALGFAALMLCLAAGSAPAGAVVIDGGDGSGNTSPPGDDPGWDAVGIAEGLTGVYLGRGWVLTANHVGEKDITLAGVVYPAVIGSKIRFMTDASTAADLAVYRIVGRPRLPEVVLSASPPVAGVDEVTLIGNGWNREPTLTEWTASWTEVPPGPVVYSGFKQGTGRSMRWGGNVVEEAGVIVTTTESFLVTFDKSGGVLYESQAVPGDSGGAVFIKRNDAWELVGILFSRLLFTDQPSETAVFGNQSAAADVSFYREQILAAMNPEIPALPLPAVFVLAGVLGASARRALHAAGAAGIYPALLEISARTPASRAAPRGAPRRWDSGRPRRCRAWPCAWRRPAPPAWLRWVVGLHRPRNPCRWWSRPAQTPRRARARCPGACRRRSAAGR